MENKKMQKKINLICKTTLIVTTLLILTSCNSKKNYAVKYNPFEDIKVDLIGSDGKANITLDTSNVFDANSKILSESKEKADSKKNNLDFFKSVSDIGTYEISKESELSNGDEIIITFNTSKSEISEPEKFIAETNYIYKVTELEKLFTEKEDITQDDYEKIKSKSLSNIKTYISKLSSNTKSFENLYYKGQFLIRDEQEPMIATFYTTVASSIMTDKTQLNEYVYLYTLTNIEYNTKEKVIYNFSNDINYISRYYQTDDIQELLKDRFQEVEEIELIIDKKFKIINDLDNSYINTFDEDSKKMLDVLTKDYEKENLILENLKFYKCYMLTDKYVDSTNKNYDRNSLSLVYTYDLSSLPVEVPVPEGEQAVTTSKKGYFIYNINYFLYNDINVLDSYKVTTINTVEDFEIEEKDIINLFKNEKTKVEEVPIL